MLLTIPRYRLATYILRNYRRSFISCERIANFKIEWQLLCFTDMFKFQIFDRGIPCVLLWEDNEDLRKLCTRSAWYMLCTGSFLIHCRILLNRMTKIVFRNEIKHNVFRQLKHYSHVHF